MSRTHTENGGEIMEKGRNLDFAGTQHPLVTGRKANPSLRKGPLCRKRHLL